MIPKHLILGFNLEDVEYPFALYSFDDMESHPTLKVKLDRVLTWETDRQAPHKIKLHTLKRTKNYHEWSVEAVPWHAYCCMEACVDGNFFSWILK